MTMHVIAALVCLTSVLLYADRSAYLVVSTHQPWSAHLTRLGIGLWMVANCTGFVDLAVADAPFVWRHWLVLTAMSLTVAGHLGLRFGSNRAPT